MVLTVTMVTGNPKKAQAVLEHTAAFGLQVEHKALPLIEPQADTIEDVALSKAKQAFQMLHTPVLVEDSGFCIDALSNFPGPYTKYALATIGAVGLLNLARDLPTRTCRFRSVLTYVDDGEQAHFFVDERGVGTLASAVDNTPCPEAWSDLWRIFIPANMFKPLTALSAEERNAALMQWQGDSVYTRFGQWYRQKQAER